MFEGWNGTMVVSKNRVLDRVCNHPNEQGNAADVVMGGVHIS